MTGTAFYKTEAAFNWQQRDSFALKEILSDGISVISTDHAKMGETAAMLILENKKEKIKNPFTLILRKIEIVKLA